MKKLSLKKIIIAFVFILLLVILFYLVVIKQVHKTLLFWYIWPSSIVILPFMVYFSYNFIMEVIENHRRRKHEKDDSGFSLHSPDNDVC